MGIIFLRFAAGIFIKLLEKLPKLEDLAYQLIFFVGIKLMMESLHIEISHSLFWVMMGVIATIGSALVYRDHYQRTTQSRYQSRLLQQLRAGEIPVDDVLALEYIPKEIIDHLLAEGTLKVQPRP
ncbi:MAG: hypothetical protein A2521_07105 [Deltaproteobacteria bacterium RIFOXYD12_FULL_57_12]|nr:MAG: hypothetical protein A2521_07105 [Deltaproteobacteria bacterium RIFOXYD12_FULL_57_12]